MQMNKHGMMIMNLMAVTSIGNKTKHTYTVQKNKPNFKMANISIRTSEILCESPNSSAKLYLVLHGKSRSRCLTFCFTL